MLVAIHASALRHTRTSPIFLVTVFKSSTGSKQFCTNSPFDTGIERTRTRGVLRVISTLNPLRLDPANFLDISHSVCTNVAFLSRPSLQNSQDFTLPRFELIFRHERRDGLLKDVRFPMDTRGFLYYHSPAKFPATAGEIRFRITENNRPSSFFRGKDLLSHRGVPWRIPLLTIASDSLACYKPIREQLLLENLVTEEQLVTCARIFSSNSFQTNSIIVHSLDQLFPITFGSSVTLWAVAQGAAWHVRIQKLFHDMRLRPSQSPYAGSALVRFERSTLTEHANTRTLVMRIVKIIEPVKRAIPDYDGFILEPAEGALLPQGLKSKVWFCNVDSNRPTAQALRHLVPVDGTASGLSNR